LFFLFFFISCYCFFLIFIFLFHHKSTAGPAKLKTNRAVCIMQKTVAPKQQATTLFSFHRGGPSTLAAAVLLAAAVVFVLVVVVVAPRLCVRDWRHRSTHQLSQVAPRKIGSCASNTGAGAEEAAAAAADGLVWGTSGPPPSGRTGGSLSSGTRRWAIVVPPAAPCAAVIPFVMDGLRVRGTWLVGRAQMARMMKTGKARAKMPREINFGKISDKVTLGKPKPRK
jgi:hypothetical protein